jgi:transcriptional regulator with XRE-family HTH domain
VAVPVDQDVATALGRAVVSMRRARLLTQDRLACASCLSTDTVRRIEQGSFSPSLDTLLRLSRGLRVRPSTLLEALDLGEPDPDRELTEAIRSLPADRRALALRLVRALCE